MLVYCSSVVVVCVLVEVADVGVGIEEETLTLVIPAPTIKAAISGETPMNVSPAAMAAIAIR
jgi:hypothetical protein